jgi:hypothetical protein
MSNIKRPVAPDTSATMDQAGRFKAAAQQLGADEDEATFKAKLAVIGKQKPKGEFPLPAAQGKKSDGA